MCTASRNGKIYYYLSEVFGRFARLSRKLGYPPRELLNSSILLFLGYGANMPWTNPNPAPICPTCSRSVFPAEAYMASDRRPHHKQCVKCVHCSKRLSAATLNEHTGKLYCNTCYANIFMPQVDLSTVYNEIKLK